jgi:ElaB/YqjD/DUF883 family membrane-anchored ribosome-binding protein
MAKTRRNSRTEAESAVNDLQKDLDTRVEMIRTELMEKGPEAAAAVEKSLNDLKDGFEARFDSLRDSIDEARESLDDAVESGRTTIRDQPLMAVGIAVAAGVVIGLLFGRKSKS